MTGADVDASRTRADVDPATKQPIVVLGPKPAGAAKFARVTRCEALRGRLRRTPQHFAIVLNGVLKSFPFVDYRTFPHRLTAARRIEIANLASRAEAQAVALAVAAGTLPFRFVLVHS